MRVLFVSKPVVPPWNDGSKNLVRDLASHFTRNEATVMVTEAGEPLRSVKHVKQEEIYRAVNRGFSPSIQQNARVLSRLLRGDPHDLWHFVFAPNLASSLAAHAAKAARRARGWKGRIVQTVASAPREFHRLSALLFGDIVVAQSAFTRERLLAAGASTARVKVVPPCAAPHAAPSAADRKALREQHGLGSGPLFVYAGDYEVSRGAETTARAADSILRADPSARIVFACRAKTPHAAVHRARIEVQLAAHQDRTFHLGELPSLGPLIAEARALLFPVDDLYGKVDLPLVLLEGLAMGTPLVLARGGPLEEIGAARYVDVGDAEGLAREAVALLREDNHTELAAAGRAAYEARYTPEKVAAAYEDLYDSPTHT